MSRLKAINITNLTDTAVTNNEPELHLRPIGEVADELGAIDWSFTEADTRLPGHDIHPYPAKFIPQLPHGLISRLSGRGEMVLDPFGGSGTTALEAVKLGRKAISIDANPLSALIGRVKTARLEPETLKALNVYHSVLLTHLEGGDLSPSFLISNYSSHAPKIVNQDKWFADTAYGELCLIRAHINELDSTSQDIALVALSRIVIKASFQDSETRYKSIPREVPSGETLRRYLREFTAVVKSVEKNEAATRYGISQFLCDDIRLIGKEKLPDGIADLVVTSPPYGNATDYHLYHRFRLLWLGFDPIALGHIEIGSHLKHQRESSGFESYLADMEAALATMHRALKPGRYAALVIGDSVYNKKTYDPAEALYERADSLGFEACTIVDRAIHSVKRSFSHAGRRATSEHILVLRRKVTPTFIQISPPPYKLWPYEAELRVREIGLTQGDTDPSLDICLPSLDKDLRIYKRAAFSHSVQLEGGIIEPTWQAVLENGEAWRSTKRKDPKYVTHGIHSYKGKFYPQLAKSLLNISGFGPGATVLDLFCGSGTTLLEGYLNGFRTLGCDMNPLAAKISRAKLGVLDLDPDTVREVILNVRELLTSPPFHFPQHLDCVDESCHEEIFRWFSPAIAFKLNWVLGLLRKVSAGVMLDFLEIILSSIIREVSNQEPTDLRIRYRPEPLIDADVLGLFQEKLDEQFNRIEKFWKIRNNAPQAFFPSVIIEGDNKKSDTFTKLGLEPGSVDLMLTSPPYGTALPYIDTDRLSLLFIMGLTSSERKPVETGLTGSREISTVERRKLEQSEHWEALPCGSQRFISTMQKELESDKSAGFRKRNMPALMVRYLIDMSAALGQAKRLLRSGGEMMIVIGDNKTTINGKVILIPCTDLIEEIACTQGMTMVERIDISVTTENFKHIKNAIVKNVVLRLRKP
ncbi:site-specific DNA-methyltransferase [Morganella morganii]|nr:site-specific DNA-methyltransferase [Morganella morganii]MCU6211453.1 site-specific DNA-methyltransferase [Morganella morganii]